MKSIYNLIISTDKRYNNEIEVEGGSLVVNTEITERDYEFVNRIGTVEALPMYYDGLPIKVGDKVVVHHNVFRRWYDVRGNERNSGNYIDEDKYYVNSDQVYAYDNGNGWIALPGYSFVAPINDRLNDWSLGLELPKVGEIIYGYDQLGLDKNDLVGWTPESEFEFELDGQKLYRIKLNDITWTSKRNVNELLSQPS